ncbi:casein kinase substrate phosphoprotein PP28-domain-containing protein [Mortierella sp. GBAus27b]|nr:casein kinase substrate phosphoprotein PP28-domain-containing protein [Mortierella sp. GBAus27b]
MAGGKFKKPQRGGGRTFSRRIETVNDNYRNRQESDEESSDESSETSSGSESESGSEEEAQQTKKEKASNASAPIIDVANPNRAAGSKQLKASDLSTPVEMSRREREAVEREANAQKYWKMHQEGKTDQAKADMARLAIVRQRREEAAAKRLAETQGKETGWWLETMACG